MNKHPEFWQTLIGSDKPGIFAALCVFGFACAIISMLIQLSNSSIVSDPAHVKDTWKNFAMRNAMRTAANLMIIPLLIRLFYESLPLTASLPLVMGIGFGVDRLGMLAVKYGLFTVDSYSKKLMNEQDNQDLPKNQGPQS